MAAPTKGLKQRQQSRGAIAYWTSVGAFYAAAVGVLMFDIRFLSGWSLFLLAAAAGFAAGSMDRKLNFWALVVAGMGVALVLNLFTPPLEIEAILADVRAYGFGCAAFMVVAGIVGARAFGGPIAQSRFVPYALSLGQWSRQTDKATAVLRSLLELATVVGGIVGLLR